MRPLTGKRKIEAVLKCYKYEDITLTEASEILMNPDKYVWSYDPYEENIQRGRSKSMPIIDPDND